MSISRRKFLRAGTLVALSAALPISVLGQNRKQNKIDGNPIDQQPVKPDALAHYNRSAFSSYLNSIFQLYTGFSVVEVELVEVKDLLPEASTAALAATGRECFSLLFRGGSRALPQNTYQIDHPSLGSFQLFLVPGGPDQVGAQSYVAIINRVAYSDALDSVPSRLSKPTGRIKPEAPATTPQTTTPVQTTTPTEKPAPSRKRKPSWKSGDNEDPAGSIDH